ncbi:helix-turn-helix transcriptional regulator [Anaeromassilibacillus senegalensis]|uniref:helix-turn-helix transcriptional regulator n=1 Tax=Anaeromassilibacillus senegalensis TaxID=1673717 RepID=UPI00068157C7|nr:helix-turn-helix transcriptional regulator [Anaeromassilibacillus senegalensis]
MTKTEIANIIKSMRVNYGLTQKEMAEQLGKKQQTIASWETGQSQPDANTLFTMCALCGTTVDVAFGFAQKNSPAPEESEAEEDDPRVDKLGTPKSAYDLFYSFLIERGYLKEGDNFTPSQARFFASILEVVNSVYPAPAIQVDAENVG